MSGEAKFIRASLGIYGDIICTNTIKDKHQVVIIFKTLQDVAYQFSFLSIL